MAKSFKHLLAKRLNKHEIAEIESAAKIEYEVLKMLYMAANQMGFNPTSGLR
jgi:hypothetical protein